eukprot:gnl/Trimastix_PCT/2526.p1 GENE.gnl/Trimastix_PCT/2526~~gnl/Trimastix_PCT/2526.p1  ORF type:complete len:789 (-),score=192.35 gnl/Trimastix_PCT/2526:48-2414(-)
MDLAMLALPRHFSSRSPDGWDYTTLDLPTLVFQKGDKIIEARHTPNCAFIIKEGIVRLEGDLCETMNLISLGPGSIFGDLALFSGNHHFWDVVVESEECFVYTFTERQFICSHDDLKNLILPHLREISRHFQQTDVEYNIYGNSLSPPESRKPSDAVAIPEPLHPHPQFHELFKSWIPSQNLPSFVLEVLRRMQERCVLYGSLEANQSESSSDMATSDSPRTEFSSLVMTPAVCPPIAEEDEEAEGQTAVFEATPPDATGTPSALELPLGASLDVPLDPDTGRLPAAAGPESLSAPGSRAPESPGLAALQLPCFSAPVSPRDTHYAPPQSAGSTLMVGPQATSAPTSPRRTLRLPRPDAIQIPSPGHATAEWISDVGASPHSAHSHGESDAHTFTSPLLRTPRGMLPLLQHELYAPHSAHSRSASAHFPPVPGRINHRRGSWNAPSLHASLRGASSTSPVSWSFDVRSTEQRNLASLVAAMICRHARCIAHFAVAFEQLLAFTQGLFATYNPNPFHDVYHAADVTLMCLWMLGKANIEGQALAYEEVLGLLLACIGHDAHHPGHNNEFEVLRNTPLAQRFHNRSVLENMHLETTLRHLDEHRVIAHLPQATQARVRDVLKEAILSTDMTRHFDICRAAQFQGDVFHRAHKDTSASQRTLLVMLLIKACDIANPMRPFPIALDQAIRCLREFTTQGDAERALGAKVPGIRDRETMIPSRVQCDFIRLCVRPLFLHLARSFPALLTTFRFGQVNQNIYTHQTTAELEDGLLNGFVRPEKKKRALHLFTPQ